MARIIIQGDDGTTRVIFENVGEGSAREVYDRLSPAPVAARKRVRTPAAKGDELHETVLDILSGAKGPMRLKDLRDELQARGVDLPGQGNSANLVVHLNRLPQVTRPKYGHYALKTTTKKKTTAKGGRK